MSTEYDQQTIEIALALLDNGMTPGQISRNVFHGEPAERTIRDWRAGRRPRKVYITREEREAAKKAEAERKRAATTLYRYSPELYRSGLFVSTKVPDMGKPIRPSAATLEDFIEEVTKGCVAVASAGLWKVSPQFWRALPATDRAAWGERLARYEREGRKPRRMWRVVGKVPYKVHTRNVRDHEVTATVFDGNRLRVLAFRAVYSETGWHALGLSFR